MLVTLRLNPQQRAVLDDVHARRPPATTFDDLLAAAVAHDAAKAPDPRWARPRPAGRPPSDPAPDARLDVEVPAGTGRGVVLAPGEVLRVEQLGGGQCADLNAFAWSGPRRRFDAARTRAAHGARVTTGAVLWSAPPEVALLELVADDAGPHDLLYPACSAHDFAAATGQADHSNCVELQAQAQRAWGLEGEVHDPLNLWLPTDVDPDGTLRYWPSACRAGDAVELRALHDVLVVVNPCGSDLYGATQYELDAIRMVVRTAGAAAPATAVPTGPEPVWRWRDLPMEDVAVQLADDLAPHVARVRAGGWLGDTDAAVCRALLLRWWEDGAAGAGPA
jgi:uncharacterized protein YcgI (DUF1989 family)